MRLVPTEGPESVASFRTKATDRCELHVGAGTQTQILHKAVSGPDPQFQMYLVLRTAVLL